MKNIIIDCIAVFILGTTKPFGGVSSFQSRMMEISETWAKPFEHVYFVMGTNKFDNDFLQDNCAYKASFGISREGETADNGGRRLIARTPQTPHENLTRQFECDYSKDLSHWVYIDNSHLVAGSPERAQKEAQQEEAMQRHFEKERHSLQVLYVGNCTGEYFGIGPACRYQETARYFLSHADLRPVPSGSIRPKSHEGKFRHVEWFLFVDDDLYVRPFSLLSILHSLPKKHSGESAVARMKGRPGYIESSSSDRQRQCDNVALDYPLAILAPLFQRSFRFSQRWDRKVHKCEEAAHNLHIAMPALINREAMALMGNAVEANGMTEHQRIWGGTHDMLLALWLWMYRVPQISVRNVYFGSSVATLYKEDGDHWIRNINVAQNSFVHMLKNFRIPYKGTSAGPNGTIITTTKVHTIPGMVDVAKVYGDDVLYDNMVYMLPKLPGKTARSRGSSKRVRADKLAQEGLNISDIEYRRKLWKDKHHEQVSQGKIAARTHLFELSNSRVSETAFGRSGKAKDLHENYHSFTPQDCKVVGTIEGRG